MAVIESMGDTNKNLLEKIKSDRLSDKLGLISIKKVMNLYKNSYDVIGISQLDRYVILKNQIRVILNMIPIDFENFKIDGDDIDFLQPIETLNC
jgi:hypothetical protein